MLLKQALLGIAKRNGYDPAGPMSFKTRERAQRAVSSFVQEHGLGYQFNLALQVCIYALLEKDDLLLAQFANWLARRRIADRRSERTVFISQSAENQGIADCLEAVGPRRRGTAHPPLRVTC